MSPPKPKPFEFPQTIVPGDERPQLTADELPEAPMPVEVTHDAAALPSIDDRLL